MNVEAQYCTAEVLWKLAPSATALFLIFGISLLRSLRAIVSVLRRYAATTYRRRTEKIFRRRPCPDTCSPRGRFLGIFILGISGTWLFEPAGLLPLGGT